MHPARRQRVGQQHLTAIAGSTAAAARNPRQAGQGAAEPAVASDSRSDAELVAELHRLGGPMSGRKVMRALGVGWPRAKRLVDLAGWAAAKPQPQPSNGNRPDGSPANLDAGEDEEIKPADHAKPRTTP